MHLFVPVASGPDWGSVPEWLSSVSTVLALLFAAVAAVAAQRVYRIESERDRVNAEARREQQKAAQRAQGALVSAWCDRGAGGEAGERWGVYVRNASETPVYRARLSIVDLQDRSDTTRTLEIPVISPGQTTFHPVRRDTEPRSAADLRVEMSFTDSAGVRWIRDQHGRLSELRPEVLVYCDPVRVGALTDFARRFLATHGVAVRFQIEEFVRLRESFIDSARRGNAGEILIGPHDWIPELVRLGLLEPISVSEHRLAGFLDVAVDAVRYGGQLYGVPYSLDTVALLRNTDLAPDPPETVEQLVEQGLSLLRRGKVSRPLAIWADPFHLQPFYSSAGGELFGTLPDRTVDRGDVRVASPGSVRAFARLHALGEAGSRVLRRDVAEDVDSIRLFRRRETAFAVVPARVLTELTGADPGYAVGPVPGFADGERPTPYVAVNAFVLSSRGENKGIAHDLITDYVTREGMAFALYEAQPRPLALRSAADRVRQRDRSLAVFHEECMRGSLMPMLPEMAEVWRLLGQAQLDVIGGGSPAATARRLHQDLTRLLAC